MTRLPWPLASISFPHQSSAGQQIRLAIVSLEPASSRGGTPRPWHTNLNLAQTDERVVAAADTGMGRRPRPRDKTVQPTAEDEALSACLSKRKFHVRVCRRENNNNVPLVKAQQ